MRRSAAGAARSFLRLRDPAIVDERINPQGRRPRMSAPKERAPRRARSIALAVLGSIFIVACQTASMGPDPELDAADSTPPKRMITQGVAHTIIAKNLTRCAYTHPKMNVRVAAVGLITASDGTVIKMPAET